MKYFIILLGAVLLLLPCMDLKNSQILVVLKHCTSSGNKKFIEKITTPRKPINRTTSITSFDIYFQPKVVLEAPIYYYYTTYRKFATQYKPTLVKLKFEVCNILNVRSHPVVPMLIAVVAEKDGNFLDPCPLQGHRSMKPYYTSYKHLPPLLPIGMWRVDQKLTKEFDGKEVEIFQTRDYYEISSTALEEF